MEERIETLLARLTLAEKAMLLAGADMWHTHPVPRLGIPALKVSDGPNGVRGSDGNTGPTSVCFPVGIAMGATWNPELIGRVGAVLALETKAKGARVLLAPTVNIHRTPIAGRNFECYAEDPYLSGTIATAYISGLQEQGVAACIKHFVCNDQEFERFSISSEVAERPLHEIYLEPFRIALQQANPWSIMSAYNRINGVYASENDQTLRRILKEEWAYDGYVISDWYGTYGDGVPAGYLDLEMPGPARWMDPDKIIAAVTDGSLKETHIDDKVRRLLRVLLRVGLLDETETTVEQAVDLPEHRQLARQVADEAIVLLKNERDLLPLDLDEIGSIALIGENAHWAQIMGGGSSAVNPHYAISPLTGIRERVGDLATVQYEIGTPIHRMPPLLDTGWLTAADGTSGGLTLSYFGNRELAGDPVHEQVVTKTQLSWFGTVDPYVDPANFSLRLRGTVTVPADGSYELHLWGIGRARLWIDDAVVVDQWQETGDRQAAVSLDLYGNSPVSLVLEYISDADSRWRTVRLGCMPPLPADPIQAAVNLAARSDAAIVVAGLTDEWETEGSDRQDMELVGAQNELIRRVAAANPLTIVILNVGSPVTMPWLDNVPAVLQLWYAGQETGPALAGVLFGDVNPSGRLPTTFPRRLQDNPAFLNYPGENGKVHYGEGIFVGYRYYDRKDIEPLFPFGHGLSYTRFAYTNLRLNGSSFGPGDEIIASVDVTNTGDRAGQEVVQLYVSDVASRLVRPLRELKAFTKVSLQPGETKTELLRLDRRSLAFYDPGAPGWVTEAGDFEVLVGRSVRDIQLQATFTWRGDEDGRLHAGLTMKALLDDERSAAVLRRHLGDLLDHPQAQMAMSMTLLDIVRVAPEVISAQKVEEIEKELASI